MVPARPLIRILTGISRPTSGEATIFGHDIEHDTIASRQSMGIVSENSNVYDDLTAWQNMMFSAELYHVGRKEREKKGLFVISMDKMIFNSRHSWFL
jgi:ABC-2 type transport system ATP-binding protein